jgi:uncharacterized membrane protein YqjE
MAEQGLHAPYTTSGDGPAAWQGSYGAHQEEPSLGELLKRLSNDTGDLISQEIALAKAEIRESATNIGKGAGKFAVALAFGLVGLVALTAFLVIGLGSLTGGYYAAWSLGIGLVEVIIAAIAAKSAMSSMKPRSIKPTDTIETLREDKQWAKREMRDLKHDLTSNPETEQSRRQG